MLDQDCRHRTSENSEKTRDSKGKDSNKLYSNYRRGQAVAREWEHGVQYRVNRDLQSEILAGGRSHLYYGICFLQTREHTGIKLPRLASYNFLAEHLGFRKLGLQARSENLLSPVQFGL